MTIHIVHFAKCDNRACEDGTYPSEVGVPTAKELVDEMRLEGWLFKKVGRRIQHYCSQECYDEAMKQCDPATP